MPTVKHRPLTVHDYRLLPDNGPRYQLIEGELHIMAPAPNRFHQTILGRLHVALAVYLQANPLGDVYLAPFDVYLSDINVFQPDLCYFSKSRYPSLTDAGADGSPDLVVEILSPSSEKHDLGMKREIYARTGVSEFWVVDPVKRNVAVYQLDEDAITPRATLAETKTLTTPLLPGLTVKLSDIFA